MASRELNNDKDVFPICGHGFILSNQKLSKHPYILSFRKILPNTKYEGDLYFMPKLSGFVGGTYIKDYNGTDTNYNNEMITALVERSKSIFQNNIPLDKKFTPKF